MSLYAQSASMHDRANNNSNTLESHTPPPFPGGGQGLLQGEETAISGFDNIKSIQQELQWAKHEATDV